MDHGIFEKDEIHCSTSDSFVVGTHILFQFLVEYLQLFYLLKDTVILATTWRVNVKLFFI